MSERLWSCLFMMAVAALACALYLPFLGNPMVFDDLPFFAGGDFAYFATHPVGLQLRLLPYFTLAFPQVLWGHFPPWHHAEIHRVISLVFHVGCALALFKLLRDLLRAVSGTDAYSASRQAGPASADMLAAIGSVLFLIHPVAVYGAAYLVQRTMLLATLFSLLSVICFVRGVSRRSLVDAIYGALFYTLAVFSKEHSLLLPAVAVMTAPLVTRDSRFIIRFGATYLAACLPAALTVFLLVRWVVGKGYEPAFDALLTQIDGLPLLDMPGGPWLVSAVTQTGLFFRYLTSWLAPDLGAMAIDVRVDFVQTWTPAWVGFKVVAFAAFGALGLWLLRRRGRAGLAGFGMLYAWILFAVELSSVRFQEPFVLYRSYLWAPGFLIAAAAVLSNLPRTAVLILFAAAGPLLLYQAHDRLQTFSSNLKLWEDAAAKLPATPVLLGSRVLFGMAREQVYAGRLHQAAQGADRCLADYPKTWYCNFSRGAVDVQLGRYTQAVVYLDRALEIEPEMGVIHSQRGIALERLGRLDDAREAYREASRLGFIGGDYRLGLLDNPGDVGPRTIYDASRSARERAMNRPIHDADTAVRTKRH
jgi:protein O-mannosyl-transferase